MSRKIRSAAVFLLLLVLFLTMMTATGSAAETPVPTMRIGLFWGSSALEGANLENAVGSGFAFGWFNTDREFVQIYETDEKAISMLKDWSLYFVDGQYVSDAPASGNAVRVGCYHIRLGTYESLEDTLNVTSLYEDGFPAYLNGSWTACAGSYVSRDATELAIEERGISGTAGTASSRCVTVVKTGTDRVLFQFDDNGSRTLGVMPRAGAGEKAITWFRGYRYYGGFQYDRRDGGDLTVVNFVDMDDYISGVVPYEMSPSWPQEALKAQAVAARTYAMANLNSHRSYGFDLCNSTCCQAYRGYSASEACEACVRDTSGIIMTWEGKPIEAVYHSCDGGATENSENVFYQALPYLRGKEDPYESSVSTGYENWSFTYTNADLTGILRAKGYACGNIVSITPTYTAMGNIYSLKLTDENGKTWSFTKDLAGSVLFSNTYGKYTYSQRFTVTEAGRQLQTLYVNGAELSQNSLSGGLWAVGGSSEISQIGASGEVTVLTAAGAETVSLNTASATLSSGTYIVQGSGWGHNVGMSQYGAKAMAQLGYTYRDILSFYYDGVTIG